MNKQRDWTPTISRLTGWLVGLLAAIAFVLSYNALRHVAADNGIPYELSYVWPLLVDFALIVFSLAVLTANLHGEGAWRQWALTGLFTVATIGFNLIHAPANPVAQVVAVVAPVALFLSFETLMAMVKSGVKRRGLAVALTALTSQVDTLRNELAVLEAERQTAMIDIANQRQAIDSEVITRRKELAADVKTAKGKLDTLRQEYETLSAEMQRLQSQPSPKQANLDSLLSYLASNPQATLTAAASELGVSRQTAGNYVNELAGAGKLHKNGHGWKVNGNGVAK